MKLYIGQEMWLTPEAFIDNSKKRLNEQAYPCEVVYINWEHRFFTAKFTFPGGTFRESFKFYREE